MSPDRSHRIDPPSTAVPRMAGPRGGGPSVGAVPITPSPNTSDLANMGGSDDFQVSRSPKPQLVSEPASEEWLRLHANDLIDRLQTWAADLDSREAQLNARASLQDHRERRSRLQQQDLATQLAEQERSVERLRKQIEAQARRLAFRDESAS